MFLEAIIPIFLRKVNTPFGEREKRKTGKISKIWNKAENPITLNGELSGQTSPFLFHGARLTVARRFRYITEGKRKKGRFYS